MNAMSYLLKGGPVMYVLLPMSAITLAVGVERLVVLGRERRQTEATLDILRKNVMGKFDAKAVIALFDGEGRSGSLIINRLLRLFIESELEGERLEFLIEAEALQEERRLNDRMWVLDTAVTMAPLLGLLGTIIGIVSSFHVMSISGLGKPTQITGGGRRGAHRHCNGTCYCDHGSRFLQLPPPMDFRNQIFPRVCRSSHHDPSRTRPGDLSEFTGNDFRSKRIF